MGASVCTGEWAALADGLCQSNGVSAGELASAIYTVLDKGGGKGRGVVLFGETTSARPGPLTRPERR